MSKYTTAILPVVLLNTKANTHLTTPQMIEGLGGLLHTNNSYPPSAHRQSLI